MAGLGGTEPWQSKSRHQGLGLEMGGSLGMEHIAATQNSQVSPGFLRKPTQARHCEVTSATSDGDRDVSNGLQLGSAPMQRRASREQTL